MALVEACLWVLGVAAAAGQLPLCFNTRQSYISEICISFLAVFASRIPCVSVCIRSHLLLKDTHTDWDNPRLGWLQFEPQHACALASMPTGQHHKQR